MINNTYDPISPAIISPHQTIKAEEKKIAADIKINAFIIVFSHQLIDLLIKDNKIEIRRIKCVI